MFQWQVQSPSSGWVVKKFPKFYRTIRFITTFPTACHSSLFLSQINPSHTLLSYSVCIHFNITLPTSEASKLTLSFRVPQQNHLCMPLLPRTCHMACPFHLTPDTCSKSLQQHNMVLPSSQPPSVHLWWPSPDCTCVSFQPLPFHELQHLLLGSFSM